MSGICGWVGTADPPVLDRMLDAIDYRGDTVDRAFPPGAALGYRFWSGRPGKSPGIHRQGSVTVACAGTLAPAVPSPAASLASVDPSVTESLEDLDGAFAAARWDEERRELFLLRDPFGVRSLYYVMHGGVLYFASELKQLLAVPGLPVELDAPAVHKYLTFSFVPGEDVPVRGIKRLLPGSVLRSHAGGLEVAPYVSLREEIDPALADQAAAVRFVRRLCREAVRKRLNGEPEVAVFLSGGLDSSGVASWLRRAGVGVRGFSLDFGETSVETGQARQVAAHLRIPHELIQVGGAELGPVLLDLAYKLDLPFGDPVTGPQYLLGMATRRAGLSVVFNGEGGDQLFGGWTSKPMVAAEVYGRVYGHDSREETYLESYHRFYGREEELYTDAFKTQVGGPGQRRQLLAPHLGSDRAATFLNRVRLADISLKGSQNILPRAERMTNCWGLDLRVPLFDRALVEGSFRLPPSMKLRGACEKFVLKLVLQKHLPPEIVWRRKFGMSVPVTDWLLGPLRDVTAELLGPDALARRGLFQGGYVERLRTGIPDPADVRRRRLGEKLWTLLMLEAWMRIFIDGRGRRPGSAA